ncbi:MAG: EVE domain-containing protein [Chloroflexi bacterium]|nr:EVE domain-containing protein [Chloroflexota bacterium]MBP8060024.1 EVE domain-containing protein [Chloroflexota bacterium]
MLKPTQTIQYALKNYDRAAHQDHVTQAEQERQAMQQRFPLESWPDMRLEQYALGQPDSAETYCRWLEFGTPHMGSMRGGSSLKHLIYKHKNKPGWYYPPSFSNEQEAWQQIREDFVRMFTLAREGRWAEIGEIESLGRALKLKSLHLYFPDDILPITSSDHLQHFLQRLGAFQEEMKNWDGVRLNRHLLQTMRGYGELQEWSSAEMVRFLYAWADPRKARRVVKIAPGERGRHWDDCLSNGYICVGWDDTGDLREFESEDEFRERFATLYASGYNNHKPTISKKAKEVWRLMELEPGDLIVANQGLSHVLAVGEVIEPGYEWHPERPEYKHTVRVQWDTSFAKEMELPKRWATVTVTDVGLELSQRILTKGKSPALAVPVPDLYLELAEALERRGQVILYGPPGTGKTFHVRRFAVWWLRQHGGDNNAAAVLATKEQVIAAERQLKTLQITRRVWWVVANPKEWSWDQLFKDGQVAYRYGRLQRNYPLVQPGDLVVGYQSTPDKRIVALAEIKQGLSQPDNGEPTITLKPLHRVTNGPTYAELLADSRLSQSEPMRFHCQGTLFSLTESEADYLLALLAERDSSLTEITNSEHIIGPLTWTTFHPSYSYEDFIEGFRPVDTGNGSLVLKLEDGLFKQICRAAQAHPRKHYLLIIDEINRANLAKVFGEIITLLEKDKRGLVVTLPQSKESFTIPPNVFVLGTMNTADRSIKLMDAALRRRFAFMEIMPDVSPLQGATINNLPLDDFLEALNKRIAAREGREKQIGHAYFLDGEQPISEPEEFARRFRQEILPLLQEYCYDDYAELAYYLGAQLINEKDQTLNTQTLSNVDSLLEALTALVNEEARA